MLAAIGLLAVVAADMLHRLQTTRGTFPMFTNPIFGANWDRGFAEWVGYTQLAIAALALVCVALRQRRAWTHLVLAATFVWIIADDSFELHENWGGALSDRFAIPHMFGVRGHDIGELMAWGLMGLPVLIALPFAWWFSAARARRQAWVIVAGIALIAFFAAGVDMLTQASYWWGWTDRQRYFLNLAESAGELASISVIMLSSLWFAFSQGRPRYGRHSVHYRPPADPAAGGSDTPPPARAPRAADR